MLCGRSGVVIVVRSFQVCPSTTATLAAAKTGDEDRAAIARGDHMHGIGANADAVYLLGRAAAQVEGDQAVGGDIGDVERLAIGGKPQPVDALRHMPGVADRVRPYCPSARR